MDTTNQRSVVHSTFSIERTYPVPPSRVFAAFADQRIKRRWFVEGEGWEIDEFSMDFRVGGREVWRFRFQGGTQTSNETIYHDIVQDQRIISAYIMTVGDTRISVSLATVEIEPFSDGARLVYTEQGAFLDGADQPQDREQGCREMLEHLVAELRTQGEAA